MTTAASIRSLFLAAVLAAAAASPASRAAEVYTSNWKCSQCPFPDGLVGSTEAEALSVSDDSSKFGQYNGLDDDGGYGNANVDLRYYDDSGYGVDLQARDLGLDVAIRTEGGGFADAVLAATGKAGVGRPRGTSPTRATPFA